METKKINKKNALMVAHTGLSGLETENTCAAFIAAGNRSYYGIETDLHRTSDGNYVCIHDRDMKRMAGEDIKVDGCSLAVCQSVVLYDKDGTKNRADLRVPTLQNYISICKKYGKVAVLELKPSFTEQEIADIIAIIESYEYLDSVTFIAFDYENLVKIKAIRPNQTVQFLTCEYTDELIDKLLAHNMDLDILYNALTKEIVEKLHSNGIKINCWTVDDSETAELIDSWGVDYITSNICE